MEWLIGLMLAVCCLVCGSLVRQGWEVHKEWSRQCAERVKRCLEEQREEDE